MTEPLKGIRVVELTDSLAGAICGKFFAWSGADVLLVERPRSGSEVRWQPPFLDDLPGPDRSGLFLYTAAGKRSLTLDPNTPDGQEILKQLLARADLLIEDRSGEISLFTEKNGLHEVNPRLVRLTLRKFSRGGPYEDYAATELQLAALGGWMVQVGEPGRTPLVSHSVTMTAFVPGMVGAISALAAVLRSRGGGEGTHIDLSAHEALLFNTRYNETYYSYTGVEIKRYGRSFVGWSPTYRVFEAADGFVSCAASTDAQVELLMQLAGVESDRYATRDARYQRADEFVAQLSSWSRSITRDEAFHKAQEWRIPMGKVSTIDEVARLEQLLERGFFVEVDHPAVGRRTYPGSPAQFSETPPVNSGRAPLLGEHTGEVLCGELGYSREDLSVLAKLGVI